MQKFYFTFGTDGAFPYQGGWVELLAEGFADAFRKFRARFPDRHEGCLNCSDYYTANTFAATGMQQSGNRGAFCHEVIQ